MRPILPNCLLTASSQKIDAAVIQSSTKFHFLETQTQDILSSLTNINENLSNVLFEFLTRLLCRSDSLNQDEHHQTRQVIAGLRDQVSPSSTADVITAQFEMLSVNDEEEKALRRTVQKQILEMLRYPYMTDRYEQLVEAHPDTFEWIFSDSDSWKFPWTDFGKWLREGEGIYWIKGKPASGKSTLMKHIYDDRRTRQYLEQWSQKGSASAVPCCLATFFFWSTGTMMQKSQEGLLRSLLFQILGQYPQLIPLVFPLRWAQIYIGSSTLGQEIQPESWSSKQLHDAFERLTRQTKYPLKICFCIDGLTNFTAMQSSFACSSRS